MNPGPSRPAPFDTAAATYDATFTQTELGRRLRRIAWRWMDRAFAPGDRILELGCGTGADAVHLAGRGVAVVATDVSGRMLEQTRARVIVHEANDLVRVEPLDAADLAAPDWAAALGAPFDGILADFGGLNCIPDRPRMLAALATVLRPGGRALVVAMGPLCPWEIAWHVLHREPHAAIRRWRDGAPAAVGDRATVRVWYPSSGRVAREAAPWFRVVRRGGIGVVLPPSGLAGAMERRRWILRLGSPVERVIGSRRPGALLADHWVLELERRDA